MSAHEPDRFTITDEKGPRGRRMEKYSRVRATEETISPDGLIDV